MTDDERPGDPATEGVEAPTDVMPAPSAEADGDAMLVLSDGARIRYSAPDTQLVTLAQASEICNASVKSLQRRWDRGQFEGAGRVREDGKNRRREVTVGSLRNLGLWPDSPAVREVAGLSPAEQREEVARLSKELALRDEQYEQLRTQMDSVMESVGETNRQIAELLAQNGQRDQERERLRVENAELKAKLQEPIPMRDRLRSAITGRRR